MKKIIILILHLTFLNGFSQETKRQFTAGNKAFDYCYLELGKNSHTKPMQVIVCDDTEYNNVKDNIKSCYQENKLEYTDYYILPLPAGFSDEMKENITTDFLKNIDRERIAKNLSTVLIKFKYLYDKSSKKMTVQYFGEETLPLNKISILHMDCHANMVCSTIGGKKT